MPYMDVNWDLKPIHTISDIFCIYIFSTSVCPDGFLWCVEFGECLSEESFCLNTTACHRFLGSDTVDCTSIERKCAMLLLSHAELA